MTDHTAPPRLEVRQIVQASPATVFAAWTDPTQVVRWWGPPEITCTHAEIELRVGGRFRLANTAPDGSTVWITGVYETIIPDTRLVHTWSIEPALHGPAERVTVDFAAHELGTEVTVVHTGIASPEARAGHRVGWIGCLTGLKDLLGVPEA